MVIAVTTEAVAPARCRDESPLKRIVPVVSAKSGFFVFDQCVSYIAEIRLKEFSEVSVLLFVLFKLPLLEDP